MKKKLIITFIFDREEVLNNQELQKFFGGEIQEENAPFIFFSEESFKKVTHLETLMTSFYHKHEKGINEDTNSFHLAESFTSSIINNFGSEQGSEHKVFIAVSDFIFDQKLVAYISAMFSTMTESIDFDFIIEDPLRTVGGYMVNAIDVLSGDSDAIMCFGNEN